MIWTFNSYVALVVEPWTHIRSDQYLYFAAGLIGEIGEVISEPTSDELGDVVWYLCALVESLNLDFDPIHHLRETPLDDEDMPVIEQWLWHDTAELVELCNKKYRFQNYQNEFSNSLFSGSNIPRVVEDAEFKNVCEKLCTAIKYLAQKNDLPEIQDVLSENHRKLSSRNGV